MKDFFAEELIVRRKCQLGNFLKWFSNEKDYANLDEDRTFEVFGCWYLYKKDAKNRDEVYTNMSEELSDNGYSYMKKFIENENVEIELRIREFWNGPHTHSLLFDFNNETFAVDVTEFPFESEYQPLVE